MAEAECIGNFRQNTPVDLQISLLDVNGTALSNTTITQLTVQYPNSSILIQNRSMQWNENYFNYTLTADLTTTLGTYDDKIYFRNSNATGFVQTCHIVTPTGTTPSTTEGILYFASLIVGLFIFTLCLIGAINIPWNHNRNEEGSIVRVNDLKYVKLFLWFASYLLLIAMTYLAYNITYGFLSFNTASNIFNAIYWFLISMLFPIMVIFMITTVVTFVESKKIKEALRRGFTIS